MARRLMDRVACLAFFAFHRKHIVLGIRVIVSDPTADEGECVRRVEHALRLLADIDPRRFQAVRRYVKHVIVWPGDYTAYDRWGGIHISATYLLAVSAPAMAGGLVHEMVHLRVEGYGICYDPNMRERIETLCVREEASFLRRLPGECGNALADEAVAGLSTPWWTDADRAARVRRNLDRVR